MQLILAEKPSVARDIVQALSPLLGAFAKRDGYWESASVLVSYAIGHLVEIDTDRMAPRDAALPIIPTVFELRPIERTQAQFRLLSNILNHPDVTNIVNACDAGREGELIFRLILQAAGIGPRSGKHLDRMWLQSMTHEAIQDCYAYMRSDEDVFGLAQAAYSRMEADWLVGINASRAISQKVRSSMSAGRVQTPTLAMIVQRGAQIRDFKPVDYFEVHATFAVQAGTYVGKFQNLQAAKGDPAERIPDLASAQAVVAHCAGQIPTSVTEEAKVVEEGAPRLFDLTTLQREANKKFGLSANETLMAAQSLYETHRALTYPRTSANTLPDDYMDTAQGIVQALARNPAFTALADTVLSHHPVAHAGKRVFDSSKVSDHFAIIPTGEVPSGLSPGEAAIYELVTRRFLAAFYPAAQYRETIRMTHVNSVRFKSRGRVQVAQGWTAVYQVLAEDDAVESQEPQAALARYIAGESVSNQSVKVLALKTKPPKPFTEASLLAAMEHAGRLVQDAELADAMKEQGLGTPATRAAIIERLLEAPKGQQAYVQRVRKKNLVATQRGIDLITMLQGCGCEILTSPTLTGDWEHKLLKVEKGAYARPEFMRGTAELTRHLLGQIQAAQSCAAPLHASCPKCSGALQLSGRTVDCACGWQLWMSMANRPFTKEEVEVLLTQRSIGPLAGFVSSRPGSKPFSATVILDAEGKPAFSFAMQGSCPRCAGAALQDGAAAVSCPGCGWRLWKTVASKTLSDKQIQTLLSTRKLGNVDGFISARSGKAFSAALRISDDDFTVKFVFD